MNITKVTDGITRITTNVENILFEGFWDLPHGVSLNSYIIKGEKTAIVDGVLCYSDLAQHFKEALDKMDVQIETVDYLIINHMEPDHSGWISTIEKLKPEAKILCSQKSANLLNAFFEHTDNIQVVKEGDSVDLGAGRVLQFIDIPNVHWPDTIATFDTLSGTLFPCDAFGSFGSVSAEGYDDLLDDKTLDFYESEALRYYANIIGAFSLFVDKAVAKCRALPIKIVAPGHGIVWRKNPQRVIDDYARYAGYQKGPCKKEATLLWGSMYGMTRKAIDVVIEEFEKAKMTLHIHNVSEDTWSHMLASVWQSQGVVLAMPTYEYKMYPPMAAVLEEICRKKAQNRLAFRLGSFGWSGGAQKDLDEMMEKYRTGWDFIEPVEFNGSAKTDDIARIRESCQALIAKINQTGN